MVYFYVSLAVHLSTTLVINQHNTQYDKFIICLDMLEALLCLSYGGQNCIIQHLVLSHL